MSNFVYTTVTKFNRQVIDYENNTWSNKMIVRDEFMNKVVLPIIENGKYNDVVEFNSDDVNEIGIKVNRDLTRDLKQVLKFGMNYKNKYYMFVIQIVLDLSTKQFSCDKTYVYKRNTINVVDDCLGY